MPTKKEIAELNKKIAADRKAAEKASTPPMPKEMPTAPKVEVQMVKVKMNHRNRLYHPYQKRYIPEIFDEPVEMPLDSWLQCQIDVGLIRVC